MRLRLAAGLWIAVLLSATGALAELRGVRIPPSFTVEEIELIGRDARLKGAIKQCAWQIRQALDLLGEANEGFSRVGEPSLLPCQSGTGRASDEGAFDILKILKDASEQGSSRSGPAGAKAGAAGKRPSPQFTAEELALIHKDKSGALAFAARYCAWQLRRALDALQQGLRDVPRETCGLVHGDATRGTDEGALDILKILRDASGEAK